MWPDAPIGIRPPAAMVVLDVNRRNGGDAELAKLIDRHGAPSGTRTARTGSGGLHLWFRHGSGSRGALGPGIDVKSSSDYLLAPPSVHASGPLRVDRPWPDRSGPEPAPHAAHPAAPPVPPPQPAGSQSDAGLVRVVAEAPPGTRNTRLYWEAVRAHHDGLDVQPLIAAAVKAGLSVAEAEATTRSAAHAPERD
jgi:hypothetical protein